MPPQLTVPLTQHFPCEQRVPAGQTVVHVPQWLGSVARLTQAPPHSLLPVGQAQTLPTQT